NHLSRAKHRSHAVTGNAQGDIAPRGNLVRKLEPPVTRLVPDLPAFPRRDSQIEYRGAMLTTRRGKSLRDRRIHRRRALTQLSARQRVLGAAHSNAGKRAAR